MLPEGISNGEALPLIIIGAGKTLQLRNVRIVHAASLPACMQLGSGTCFLQLVHLCQELPRCAARRLCAELVAICNTFIIIDYSLLQHA